MRFAAGLHRDFILLSLENSLTRPGALEVLGSPVDLGAVDIPSYAVAGLNDHIIPWENAYRSALLLGGEPRFVLSTSGHIQALINPPSAESRASHRVTDELPEEPRALVEQVATRRGSWWPDYVEWLHERSGELKNAPAKLGGRKHKPAAKAPGSYVHAS